MTRRTVLAAAAVAPVMPKGPVDPYERCDECGGFGAAKIVARLEVGTGSRKFHWCAKCAARKGDDILERVRASFGAMR